MIDEEMKAMIGSFILEQLLQLSFSIPSLRNKILTDNLRFLLLSHTGSTSKS
ncbi:hypothetical protein B0O99DRAFT_636917 [Bisporella sp. PMI_857]|nr:hypothetical protein B0O99DRAFT_636917 [Bisporella sp. PMI_857]